VGQRPDVLRVWRAGLSSRQHACATRQGAIVIAAIFGQKGCSMSHPVNVIEGPFISHASRDRDHGRTIFRCACGRGFAIVPHWTRRRVANTAGLFASTFALGVGANALVHAALRLVH
jgi:hypothetical protein